MYTKHWKFISTTIDGHQYTLSQSRFSLAQGCLAHLVPPVALGPDRYGTAGNELQCLSSEAADAVSEVKKGRTGGVVSQFRYRAVLIALC